MPDDTEYHVDLCERVRDYCHRKGIELHYPPASESAILAAERAIGFQLPPLLRLLYSQVANGGLGLGFGTPGNLVTEGLIGCASGYEYDCDAAVRQFMSEHGIACDEPSSEKQTIEQLVSSSGWRLAPAVVTALRDYYCFVECDARPDRFMTLSDDACGCGTDTGTIELDGWTGELYAVWPGDDLQGFYASRGDSEGASTADGETAIISYLAPSLAVWLEYWLAGKEHEIKDFLLPGGRLTREIIDGTADPRLKRKPVPAL